MTDLHRWDRMDLISPPLFFRMSLHPCLPFPPVKTSVLLKGIFFDSNSGWKIFRQQFKDTILQSSGLRASDEMSVGTVMYRVVSGHFQGCLWVLVFSSGTVMCLQGLLFYSYLSHLKFTELPESIHSRLWTSFDRDIFFALLVLAFSCSLSLSHSSLLLVLRLLTS